MFHGLLRNLIASCLCAVAFALPARGAPQDPRELVFGVYPYLSPNQIVGNFTPLADYLAAALGRRVTLSSAPDFASFIERTRAGEYDLIFTAPHMGRLAQRRDGYLPLAQTGNPFVFVALVKRDSPVQSLDQLRDRAMAIGARLSMTYQVMNRALGKHGLELGRSVRFVDTASFSNIIDAISRGEADAGAAPTILLDNAPAELRARLREIHRSDPLPSFFLLGHPRIGEATHRQLQAALYAFAATPAGQAYFGKTLQLDFRPLDAASLKRMDSFATIFDAR
jgi:phosphonate transport system substrate-binding protein